jgi:pentatricopeptide repeat protein
VQTGSSNGNHVCKQQALDPNAMAYASIIKSYASVGDEGGAEDVLRRLKEKNIKPDVVMYNALLSAYATNGNWQVSWRPF